MNANLELQTLPPMITKAATLLGRGDTEDAMTQLHILVATFRERSRPLNVWLQRQPGDLVLYKKELYGRMLPLAQNAHDLLRSGEIESANIALEALLSEAQTALQAAPLR